MLLGPPMWLWGSAKAHEACCVPGAKQQNLGNDKRLNVVLPYGLDLER